MYFSLPWLTLHIRAGINISQLSISGIVAHGRCYISHCFVLSMRFLTVCHVVLVFFKCVINLTSFLFKSKFISLLLLIHLFIYLFIYYLFIFLLIKQLFSHETVKVSRLFCFFVLFLELKLQGNNPQLHYFSPVPKGFKMFFIYFHFNIILPFILKLTLFFTTQLGLFLVEFIGNGLELC